MYFKFPRIGVAALVAIGLAACSGQSTVPSAAPQAPGADMVSTAPLTTHAMSFGDAIAPDAKSPCDIATIWYFRGSCVAANIKSSPNKVTLKAYKTYALTINFPKSNANNGEFILGVGTSSKDITGTLSGDKFPDYGSIPCYTSKGKSAKCAGKAFLYLFFANASTTNTVKFPSLPSETITTTGAFPGTKSCGSTQMAYDTNGNLVGWFLPGPNAKPSGNAATIPAFPGKAKLGPRTFTIIGFACQ
jgi:hypothetical protein